jgi:phage-related protein
LKNFTFNDINSDDLGLIIKNMPYVPTAERDIESITVNGRNGNLHIDNGTYRAINYTINCIISDISKLDLIKSTLCGMGTLKLSIYPDRFFNATIKNQVDFSKYLNVLNEFPLQLELYPFAYNDEEETLNFSSSSSFDIGGNISIKPVIVVTGVGKVTINNNSIEVFESDIAIDCDLMNCAKDGLNKNSQVDLEEFPVLLPSNNSIVLGTGITNVLIKYRKGWL